MQSKEIFGKQPPEELKDKVHIRIGALESIQDDIAMLDRGSRYENNINYALLVNKVPRGDAPEKVRQAWLEVMFPHARLMKKTERTSGFMRGKSHPAPEGMHFFSVKTVNALQALIEGGMKSEYEAALWFLEQPFLSSQLLFCEDEFLIVEQSPLPINRSYENPRSN